MSGIHLALAGSFGVSAPAVVNNAVTFDGSGDYYSATGISTSATDNGKILVAGTIYWAGGDNLQQVVNLRLGTGGSDYGFWVWINGGRMQMKIVTGTGSVPTSMYEDAENSLTQNAYNQFVIYLDTSSWTTNSKIYVNGVSKAKSNEGTSAYTFNWGNTATTIKVGQKNTSQTGDGTDFNGRISQLWISNPATMPDINYFWDSTASKPRDLGVTGTETGLAYPLIYHYGTTTTFPTNRGSGFASYTLTANGNVADAEGPTFTTTRVARAMTAFGNAKISTAQSKFGGASAVFDGSGDYISLGAGSATGQTALQSNYWTVEYWARITSHVGAFQATVAIWNDVNGVGNTYYFTTNMYNGTNYMGLAYFYNSDADSGALTFGSSTLATGTWQHHAFVRNGNTMTAYLDGVVQGTNDMTGRVIDITGYNNGGANTVPLTIGGMSTGSGSFNGYLDEIRISKVARYTAAFTPPSAAFTNDADTVLLMHCNGTNNSTTFTDDNA